VGDRGAGGLSKAAASDGMSELRGPRGVVRGVLRVELRGVARGRVHAPPCVALGWGGA